MTKRISANDQKPQLYSSEVDQLLVLCEEVMRATPEGARRFIEPAPGVLARAKARQHSIVFGRRGSGKSTLLRKTAADLTIDRRPIAFVDMETFKGHSYPDVLISVLIKTLQEFQGWLESAATTPATKKSFWQRLFGTAPQRPPFNKTETATLLEELHALIQALSIQLVSPEKAEMRVKRTAASEKAVTAKLGANLKSPVAELNSEMEASDRDTAATEREATYTSHKVEYLHQNILGFQRFFQNLAKLSDGAAFLILDDLYHIRRSDQAKVLDYFHRIAKGNGLWLKVGTIKHRSQWYEHSDPPTGLKLGDDAKEINLDISLEKFGTLRDFLKAILVNLMKEAPPASVKDLINDSGIDRLIVASGGVTRDFIGIFSASILQARNRGLEHYRGPKVGSEDVNLAAGDYDPIKREEFKVDTDSERDKLEEAFQELVEFCAKQSKCNVFLIQQSLSGPVRDAIDQLIDLRLIHPVKSRVTLKKGGTELYEAFMLDLSQYTAARKIRDFEIVDLASTDKDEKIRRLSLIYHPEE